MKSKPLKSLRLAAAALALLATTASAQDRDLDLSRLPWDINAETADFDGESATIIYTGLRFSQGTTSIEADEGRANNRDRERVWQFSGNVTITVNNGEIKCDSAVLHFDGSALSQAVVKGSPASFEVRRLDADDVTYAEAAQLQYDVRNGTIEFSGDATITESGNQISAPLFVYNITERRINADSDGSEDSRVRIIYTPTDDEIEALDDREQDVENE